MFEKPTLRSLVAVFVCILCYREETAGEKIKFYFNKPVDNSVSTGTNAVYLNNSLGDTLIAYINRARYTLDIAVYNFTATAPVGPAIAVAVNNALARGVRIRWIYDGGQSNSGVPLLNTAINRLASPTTSDYTIMHNKFMVVDALSANPEDAIVWTGSANWNTQQFNNDYNNVVIIQDKPLAMAYRAHFNQMWGDTGIAPNMTLSKFGQFKTDGGAHSFVVEGRVVQVYFSPADGTNAQIQAAINTADKDLYFGMYTFTDDGDADAIAAKSGIGVYAAGIVDEYTVSVTGSEYATLSTALGARLKVLGGSDLYHSKMLIVDPSDTCADPLVLTGSHNWTASANTSNDENTLIIHSPVAANIYYQAFKKDYESMSGTLAAVGGCNTGINGPGVPLAGDNLRVGVSEGVIDIQFSTGSFGYAGVRVLNSTGVTVYTEVMNTHGGAVHSRVAVPCPGIYFVSVPLPDGHRPLVRTVSVY
jgi:phosphatidylserine/phosphatidylglycerophosphate/cardiolipin synthase-like enzyme